MAIRLFCHCLLLLAMAIAVLPSQQVEPYVPTRAVLPKAKAFFDQPAYSRLNGWLKLLDDGVSNSSWVSDPSGGGGALTLLAPSNSAIEALGPGLLNCLTGRPPSLMLLARIIDYHSIEGHFYTNSTFPTYPTMLHSVRNDSWRPYIDGRLTLLRNASTGLLTANGVPVMVPDALLIPEHNFRVHGIRDVLLPPEFTPSVLSEFCTPLLTDAQADPDLATLLSLLALPELGLPAPLWRLANSTGITIFAPRNSAFAALGDGTLTCLMNTTRGRSVLSTILQFHVLSGVLYDDDFMELQTNTPDFINVKNLTSINNLSLPITAASDFQFRLANVSFYTLDVDSVYAPDGILYPLDGVLLPPGAEKLITDAGCRSPLVAVLSQPTGQPNEAPPGFAVPTTALSMFIAVGIAFLVSTIL